jgi:transposase
VSSSRQAPEQGGQVPVDPAPRPTRRTFTTEYKAGVVAEYEAAKHGEKSAVLRREGLFHSHIQEWTRAREVARKASAVGRGPQDGSVVQRLSKSERENKRLLAENQRLKAKLAQTGAALVIMGKTQELLVSLAESSDTTMSSER